jgi:hypothetical protein
VAVAAAVLAAAAAAAAAAAVDGGTAPAVKEETKEQARQALLLHMQPQACLAALSVLLQRMRRDQRDRPEGVSWGSLCGW